MKKRLREWLFWKIWSEYREECDVDRITAIHSWAEHEIRVRIYGVRVATRSQQVEAERYTRRMYDERDEIVKMAQITRGHA